MKPLNLLTITNQLKAELNISDIRLTDDSHLHTTHQQFQSKKAYITVYIKGHTTASRLTLHRKIMAIVKQTCNIPVHALAIKIST